MAKPKCLILLSTYNGEKFLEEQLHSLQKQEGVELALLIRDDGSNDHTLSIIHQFIKDSTINIKLLQANNVGAKASFFELLSIASEEYFEYDYFAFCDQDDIWKPNKLIRAIQMLNNEHQSLPLMYCSATQMVNTDLSYISVWPSAPEKKLSIYNALVENIAVGCTSVLNKKALNLISSSPPINIKHLIMHDWWAYLCVSTFGKVIFDSEPFILYRQHSNNVLGGQTDNLFTKWKKRFIRYFKAQNHYIISNQAKEFYNCFNPLLDEQQRLALHDFIKNTTSNGLSRLMYAMRTPFYRQALADQFILKLIILLGKI
ncbi:glycosyltransferase family 2 protein [Paenibacillus sanguinis]|uniref:glycosyltransferase family 2 protein n=1 Tax=Paenibacillus sanguinis TaxID=225906 RepID=UPI00037A726C|nr:glycosyltransferase family 2 protein [Paenibacillus sanguinis]